MTTKPVEVTIEAAPGLIRRYKMNVPTLLPEKRMNLGAAPYLKPTGVRPKKPNQPSRRSRAGEAFYVTPGTLPQLFAHIVIMFRLDPTSPVFVAYLNDEVHNPIFIAYHVVRGQFLLLPRRRGTKDVLAENRIQADDDKAEETAVQLFRSLYIDTYHLSGSFRCPADLIETGPELMSGWRIAWDDIHGPGDFRKQIANLLSVDQSLIRIWSAFHRRMRKLETQAAITQALYCFLQFDMTSNSFQMV